MGALKLFISDAHLPCYYAAFVVKFDTPYFARKDQGCVCLGVNGFSTEIFSAENHFGKWVCFSGVWLLSCKWVGKHFLVFVSYLNGKKIIIFLHT